ncbi:MAG: hypothetical protein NVS2B15_27040 [Pseudarthrobacter sp.]
MDSAGHTLDDPFKPWVIAEPEECGSCAGPFEAVEFGDRDADCLGVGRQADHDSPSRQCRVSKPLTSRQEKCEADAREPVRMTKERRLLLTGPGWLLRMLTKTSIETALDEELTEHLRYGRHHAAPKVTANSRNGTRPKTMWKETTGRWRLMSRGTAPFRIPCPLVRNI